MARNKSKCCLGRPSPIHKNIKKHTQTKTHYIVLFKFSLKENVRISTFIHLHTIHKTH